MIVRPDDRLAFWASGGAIMTRRGALSPSRALDLFRFFGREAWACRAMGDPVGARHCALRATDVARALLAAEDWRAVTTGNDRAGSPLAPLRALMCDLSDAVEG